MDTRYLFPDVAISQKQSGGKASGKVPGEKEEEYFYIFDEFHV
jgi:hypothetical protein